MLSNAYFLAKIHFDTAENEPAKLLQNLLILLTRSPAHAQPSRRVAAALRQLQEPPRPPAQRGRGRVRRAELRSVLVGARDELRRAT